MKHLLKITDLSKTEIQEILDLSTELQQNNEPTLKGQNIVFAFEKPSLRTKMGTEVAINHLSGNVLHIEAQNFFGGNILFASDTDKLKGREDLKDTVKNVNQWCDAIFARVYSHQTLQLLTEYSDIPVINALCDEHHPMQAFADALTIQNHFDKNTKIKCAFVGDANNVAFSLFEILLKLGHAVSFAGPAEYSFTSSEIEYFQNLAMQNNTTAEFFNMASAAVNGADVIYTDTFVSMGEEAQYDIKTKAFKDFQVNMDLMAQANKSAVFMHCLPAHRNIEVTDAVIDSPFSLVYLQAKNRMISSKGIFTYLLTHN